MLYTDLYKIRIQKKKSAQNSEKLFPLHESINILKTSQRIKILFTSTFLPFPL